MCSDQYAPSMQNLNNNLCFKNRIVCVCTSTCTYINEYFYVYVGAYVYRWACVRAHSCLFTWIHAYIRLSYLCRSQIRYHNVYTGNGTYVHSILDSVLFSFQSRNNLCILWRDPHQTIPVSVQSDLSSRQLPAIYAESKQVAHIRFANICGSNYNLKFAFLDMQNGHSEICNQNQ